MTRENRLNLIFLAVILAILTPGAVILFRKKLQPTLRPMHVPQGVQREVAYLSPLATPPGKKRVEPPHTAKWIESLVRERIGEVSEDRKIIRPVDRDGLPLTSEKKTFQVVAAEPTATELKLWLILWDRDPPRDETWSVHVAVDPRPNPAKRAASAAGPPHQAHPFRILDTRAVIIPALVREELGETGVLRPPHEIVWQELVIPRPSDEQVRLQRGTADGTMDFAHFVPSFTNPEATGN